ncbi:MAG: YhfC family intramembrane metalloprotease [Huintestinicola sp.]
MSRIEAYYPAEVITSLVIGGILAIFIPAAAVIIYKKKNKHVPLSVFFIGCGIFVLFALVLEQLLHLVMLPVVMDKVWAYAVYGCLAAGIFEETGRFIAFKLFMKKHTDPGTSVMYGLGHGGIEAVLIFGISMVSTLVTVLTVNSVGFDSAVTLFSAGQGEETAELVKTQLEQIAGVTIGSTMLGVYERILAMTVHVSLSVVVFSAVRVKGNGWLFPVAIALHAVFDFPAALSQKGVLSVPVLYIILTLIAAIMVFAAVRCYKLLIASTEVREVIEE